ncbi:ribose 5-phosphate isomerase B [Erwinia sp. AnSW2-5]|uniref:ribose 5-phosphate isomerase B n=1 Tax=Erwinia sp. AnSW2-5 TaxID=3367692 RepID=UPI00385E6E0E
MVSIAIGADDAATELKKFLVCYLQQSGFVITDYSCDRGQHADNAYPDVAWTVANAIREGKHQRGILICGTGIGMAIVANKVPGIRAAQCHDTYSAERARKSNNAQVMTLGARVIGPELARSIVNSWLNAEFEGGGSTEKVEKISYYEQKVVEK